MIATIIKPVTAMLVVEPDCCANGSSVDFAFGLGVAAPFAATEWSPNPKVDKATAAIKMINSRIRIFWVIVCKFTTLGDSLSP